MPKLSVRPMQENDFPQIVRYWTEADPADFFRMGVEPAKVPSAHELTQQLRVLCGQSADRASAFYSIWVADGESIGYASLKHIVYGASGDMHLHMWDARARGKGYGAVLFCQSAMDFYDRFQLQTILCEPRAENPMPNRMLQRIGFPLQRTYWGSSSELSAYCELNSYLIDREIAREYLARQHPNS